MIQQVVGEPRWRRAISQRQRPVHLVGLFLIALLALGGGSGSLPIPNVPPNVHSVSSGPVTSEGRYRLLVTVSEIYHHVFVQWITYGPEGSSPKVAAQFGIDDEKLGGWKYSIKMLSDVEWLSSDQLSLRINDRRDCRISLRRDSYSVTCEGG